MRIAIKLGLATVIAAMMVWTLACGAETAGDRPPEPELRESETILEATATAPATEEQPTRPDATEVRTNSTEVRGTLIPTPEVQTDGGTNRAVTEEPSPTRRDGEVYVAPKHVPTETPTPNPTPTLDAGVQPETVWDRYSREEYLALIPDPAPGVSWGQVIPTGERYEPDVTPDGMKREPHSTTGAEREMALQLEPKMAEAVTRTEASFLGDARLGGSDVFAKRIVRQWEWVHPEIPLARMIVEAELYLSRTSPTPRTVWRGGAHFIMKDTYRKAGTRWQTVYEPELIGPVVVEETTCEGTLMPYGISGRFGHTCSP